LYSEGLCLLPLSVFPLMASVNSVNLMHSISKMVFRKNKTFGEKSTGLLCLWRGCPSVRILNGIADERRTEISRRVRTPNVLTLKAIAVVVSSANCDRLTTLSVDERNETIDRGSIYGSTSEEKLVSGECKIYCRLTDRFQSIRFDKVGHLSSHITWAIVVFLSGLHQQPLIMSCLLNFLMFAIWQWHSQYFLYNIQKYNIIIILLLRAGYINVM